MRPGITATFEAEAAAVGSVSSVKTGV